MANCWFVDGEDRWRCVSLNTEDFCIGYPFTCCYMAANAVTYFLSNSTTLPGPLWVKDKPVWPLLLDLTFVRWRVEALVKVTLFETAALTWVRGVISTVSYFCGLPRLWYSLFVVLPSWVSLTFFFGFLACSHKCACHLTPACFVTDPRTTASPPVSLTTVGTRTGR